MFVCTTIISLCFVLHYVCLSALCVLSFHFVLFHTTHFFVCTLSTSHLYTPEFPPRINKASYLISKTKVWIQQLWGPNQHLTPHPDEIILIWLAGEIWESSEILSQAMAGGDGAGVRRTSMAVLSRSGFDAQSLRPRSLHGECLSTHFNLALYLAPSL